MIKGTLISGICILFSICLFLLCDSVDRLKDRVKTLEKDNWKQEGRILELEIKLEKHMGKKID